MMRLRLLACLAALAAGLPGESAGQAGGPLPSVPLRAGLVITGSVRIAPGSYRLPGPASLDSAVVTIRGDNIVMDFAGATMEGLEPGADPDRATGVAVRIEGGRNVRVLNAKIHGYRIAVLARNTRGLSLVNNDAGYNWKPRLYSLIEHESLADWLSFHHNEQGEWLRYAAAFYLEGVTGGELVNNRVTQGMNGLLLTRSDSLWIQDNDFSFNSGLGIGLYRSSGNTIVRNRFDYNVRGYSQGFYRRGQDSAGLLLFEQSQHNIVAYNSATHGGDGLFLWAGQHTMDTGEGGANDNLFYGNDFSFAPANAMEATFSRNAFIGNRAEGSDYGLWGGYSFESKVLGNCFVRNRIGVAIEHGQQNTISGNRFHGDSLAVSLWGPPVEPSDWGYPKHRDTKSRNYVIQRNVFAGSRVTVQARETDSLTVADNDSLPRATGACAAPMTAADLASYAPTLPGVPTTWPTSVVAQKPRSAIVVDEWGPYDWKSPRLWPMDSSRAEPLHLAVLGPPGSWRVTGRRGVAGVSAEAGRVGDTLRVTPSGDTPGDWSLTLEYRGTETVSPRGVRRAAGRPVSFGWTRFEPVTDWDAKFYAWTDSTDLRKNADAFEAVLRTPPILAKHLSRLDYEWYRPQVKELPLEKWAMEATTTVALEPGAYILRAISDDGIQVWADGLKVIDRWAPHESVVDTVAFAGGVRRLKVRYYQADGWTELRLEILRRNPAP